MTVVLCNLKLVFENKVQIIVSLCVSWKTLHSTITHFFNSTHVQLGSQ